MSDIVSGQRFDNSVLVDFLDRCNPSESVSVTEVQSFLAENLDEILNEIRHLEPEQCAWVSRKVQVWVPFLQSDTAQRIQSAVLPQLKELSEAIEGSEAPDSEDLQDQVHLRIREDLVKGLKCWKKQQVQSCSGVRRLILARRLSGAASKILAAFDDNAVELSLRDVGLRKLPRVLGHLGNLRRLDLSKNKLESVPEELGYLQRLESLNLSENRLRALPSQFGDLVDLKKIDFSKNKLQNLPPAVGNWVSLKCANLSKNRLSSLPEETGNWLALEDLNVAWNWLDHLPDGIGNWQELRNLGAQGNLIEGLPADVIGLSKLKGLAFSHRKNFGVEGYIYEKW